jgi:hypothetical protein
VLLLLIAIAIVTVTFLVPSLSKSLTTNPKGGDLADDAIVQQLLLQQSQMPTDWTQYGQDVLKVIPFLKRGDACVGPNIYGTLTAGRARAFAHQLDPNGQARGWLEEYLYAGASSQGMQALESAIESPGDLPCLVDDAKKDLKSAIAGDSQATLGDPSVISTSRGQIVGAYSIEITIPFTYKGKSYLYRLDYISMASGRFRTSLWFDEWQTAGYGESDWQLLLNDMHEADIIVIANQDLTKAARGQLATPTPAPKI